MPVYREPTGEELARRLVKAGLRGPVILDHPERVARELGRSDRGPA